jgi:iron-sulfur cluster repair protein YtfE (RIC family)
MLPGYSERFPKAPVRFLPHGYIDDFATVRQRPEEDRDIDFYFAGSLTEHRKQILAALHWTHRVVLDDANSPEYLRCGPRRPVGRGPGFRIAARRERPVSTAHTADLTWIKLGGAPAARVSNTCFLFERRSMTSTDPALGPVASDGLDLLDACHVQTVLALDKLAVLMARLRDHGADPDARALAREVVDFFTATSRPHHQDEERHIFPGLLSGEDPEIVQAVLRLQQDHAWLEEDWRELAPQLDAVACGQNWFDVDILREGVDIFVALSLDHMALEESLIYPAARTRLLANERRQKGRDMAKRKRASKPARASLGGR